MTGLSSVAGAPLQAQAQVRAAFEAAGKGNWTTLNPKVANAARLAARMLRSAVERSEMQGAEAEAREADARAPDDTARRTQLPEDLTHTTGQSLDVVA